MPSTDFVHPRHRRTRTPSANIAAAFSVVAALLGLLLPGSTAARAQATYPGAAPCAGTLQACIDGVASGATIEIATATPIDENLTIDKSLTLRAAAGITATLLAADPGQGTVLLSDAAEVATIALEGLFLVRTTVAVLNTRDGSAFSIVGSRFLDDGGTDFAVDARITTSASLLLEANQFEWTGPTMLLRSAGLDETDLADIVVRANTLTSNTSDLILGPSAGGILVEATGEPSLQVRLDSNLLYDLASNTGAPSGIRVIQALTFPLTAPPPVTAIVINNTLHDLGAGPAIDIEGASATPIGGSGAGTLLAMIYNNIVSSTLGPAVRADEPLNNVVLRNDHNNLFDNDQPPDLVGFALGPTTLFVDPAYADDDAYDLRLSPISPLIDAGTDGFPPSLPFPGLALGPTDLTGGPRVIGPAVDLGAFEGPASAEDPVAIPTTSTTGLCLLALVLLALAGARLRTTG